MTTKENTSKEPMASQGSPLDDKKRAARLATNPSTNASLALAHYGKVFADQSVIPLMELLDSTVENLTGGDMKRCEEMLFCQAHVLQSIFTNLSVRAIKQDHISNLETFLRLALKAQSQCRATLETLANIKNPPLVFARQANIANGPQQVNNGTTPPGNASNLRAREENLIQSNELLELQHGERLDIGTASATSGTDKELATVGAIHRTANG